MEDCVTRKEHEEFAKRIEAEDHRQNRRIEELENSIKQLTSIAASMEKLAANMEVMIKEQEHQRGRLDAFEREPVDTWKHIKTKALDTGVGIVAGALAVGVIMMVTQYL